MMRYLRTDFLFLSCKNVRFCIVMLFHNWQLSSQNWRAYRDKHFLYVFASVFSVLQAHQLMFTMFSSSCIGSGMI